MAIADELIGVLGFKLEGQKNLKKYKRGMDQATGSTRNSSASIRAYGRAAGAGLTVAAGAMAAAAKRAANFEESLFGIQKKSGATNEQIAKLKEQIFDLGAELPVSLDEIASAFERGAAAGIPLDELESYAKLTVQVADSWDMTAESVGNAFAGFNKGLNIPLDEMEGLADTINMLADSGISDESDIVIFLDRVGATAKMVGLTARETAALGSAIVDLKIPAEVGARAMDTLFGKLVAPENLSDKSYDALGKIVGDVKEFKKLMGDDAKGGLLKFFDQLESLTGQQRISVLGALMGEGFDDEVARLVEGADTIRERFQMIKDTASYEGSISELSDKRLEMFNSQLAITRNLMDEISIKAGEAVLPFANDVLGSVNNALSKQGAIAAANEARGMSTGERLMFGLSSDAHKNARAREGGYVLPGDEARATQNPNLYRANAYENRISLPTTAPPVPMGTTPEIQELAAHLQSLNSNMASMAERVGVDANITDARQDNRQFPISNSIVVNQNIQQPSSAPGAVGQAVGNAAANSASQQSRIAAEPTF